MPHTHTTHLICSRYWAFCIWSGWPVIVMMRSFDPGMASSIVMPAPDSWRICRMREPPLPMMAPASCQTQHNTRQTQHTSNTTHVKHNTCQTQLKLLKLPTLAYRRLRGDMLEVYNIIHNIYDHESVPNLLRNNEISQRTGNRGHSLKLFTQRAKLNLRKKCISNSNNRTME